MDETVGSISSSKCQVNHDLSDSDPSAPGSTYVRLMPSGSTPSSDLESGYWIFEMDSL